ncbi:MAG: DinB family protein [Pseudomonadales bacterium]|jgi:uncharacterized damage-inducible protein DinB|nr:DinB family protein [Pseudomonadales bacterium]
MIERQKTEVEARSTCKRRGSVVTPDAIDRAAEGTSAIAWPASGRAHNRVLLRQCRALLTDLDVDAMRYGPPRDPTNTIGGHLRHALDHHEALLAALLTAAPDACVDYAARRRGTRCEQDPCAAQARVQRLEAGFARLSTEDEARRLQVLRDDGRRHETTAARELDFVASHTTHHLAIVALLAKLQGIEVPEGLGVAPSTLRHRRGR